jgi:pyruvate dehydrogenase (quinone)
MKAAGFLETGVELVNPDFAAMASGAGIFARRVEDPAALPEAMAAMLAHDGPALLDVVSARQELAMPPKIGVEQAMGFGMWLAKAVIDGRGTEILDLAKTNLWR